MDNLKGKNAVITGAASGVGAALARALDAEGMHLLLLDRDSDGLAAIAAELGDRPAVARVDVTRGGDLIRAAETAWERWDNVHLFINNAGVMSKMAPLWELDEADLAAVMAVNVAGLHHGIRAFVPRMRAQDDPAHIVVTASEAAFEARGFVAAYHASKHAALALAEGLAQELAFLKEDIRVSVLCPGPINTGLLQRQPGDRKGSPAERLAAVYVKSLERGLAPEAVAGCVVDGVKAERFYLLPHPEVRDLPGRRAQAVLDDEYPAMPDALARLISVWD